MNHARPRLRLVAAGAAAIALLAACGKEGANVPAATVNGVVITSQELVDELEAIRGNEAYLGLLEQGDTAVLGTEEGTFDTAFVATQLTIRIQYAVVEAEIAARGIEVDDACLAAAEADFVSQFEGALSPEGEPIDAEALIDAFPADYREYLIRRQAELTAMQGDLAGYPCTGLDSDEVVQTYFDEHPDEFALQYCVSLLESTTQEEADALAAQLAGGADFDELLVAQGGSPEASADQCIPEPNAVQSLPQILDVEVGDVTDPVSLTGQDGNPIFFIARLDEVREPTVENSREQIAQSIAQEIDNAFQAWLSEELIAAEVTVDPRYGTWNAESSQIDRPVGTEPTSTLPTEG